MNRLDPARRAQVVRCLVEGNSIRATVRLTGVAKNTVAKLLVELGSACSEYQDRVMRNLPCQRIQCDEVWAFVGCKQKNVTAKKAQAGVCGDVWTWTAIDADTKLKIVLASFKRLVHTEGAMTVKEAGRKGGQAKVVKGPAALSPERRKEIARKAAAARWAKPEGGAK